MILNVINPDGNVHLVNALPTWKITMLKQECLHHFHPNDKTIKPGNHRIVFPDESRYLYDDSTIAEERLKEKELLMIIRKRITGETPDPNEEAKFRGPTKEQIATATKSLDPPQKPSHNAGQKRAKSTGTSTGLHRHFFMDETYIEPNSDTQLKFRKMLITLLNTMWEMNQNDPEVQLIVHEMYGKVERRLRNVKTSFEGTNFKYSPPEKLPETPQGILQGFVEARKREFVPAIDGMETLRELGFEDGEIIEALRATRNSRDDACNWLVSTKRVNYEDELDGISTETTLFKSLVDYPSINLGLHKPKLMFALLSILESYLSVNLWLSDVEVGKTLLPVIRIFQAEKNNQEEK